MGRRLPDHHLSYEVKMLLDSARVLIDSRHFENMHSPLAEYMKSALLESYLVHLRNLKDFLWEPRRLRDDIVSEDFCTNGWNRINTKASDKLWRLEISQLDTTINKQISHLTAARTPKSKTKTKWNTKWLTCAMIKYLNDFLKNADKLSKKYRNKMESEFKDFRNEFCKKNAYSKYAGNSTTYVYESISIKDTVLVDFPTAKWVNISGILTKIEGGIMDMQTVVK